MSAEHRGFWEISSSHSGAAVNQIRAACFNHSVTASTLSLNDTRTQKLHTGERYPGEARAGST